MGSKASLQICNYLITSHLQNHTDDTFDKNSIFLRICIRGTKVGVTRGMPGLFEQGLHEGGDVGDLHHLDALNLPVE